MGMNCIIIATSFFIGCVCEIYVSFYESISGVLHNYLATIQIDSCVIYAVEMDG